MPGAEIEGNRFSSHAVSFILKNSCYIGMIKDPTTDTGERPGLHAPIVAKDLFDRVQKRLESHTVRRSNAGRKNKVPAILARLVRCYICGSAYQVTRQGSHKGLYLRMKRGANSPECICMSRSFIGRQVEQAVERFFRGFKLDPIWRDKVMKSLSKSSDAARIEKEREKIREEIRRARFEYRDVKSIDDETFATQYKKLNNRLRSLHKPEVDSVVEAGKLLENFGDVWSEATEAEKNRLLRTVFDAINVDIETRRLHSVVPRDVFALPIRSMATREGVALAEVSHSSRLLEDKPGLVYQLPTSPLKIVFTDEFSLVNLPERIRDRRLESCITQAELSERLDVAVSAIGSWERGTIPAAPAQRKLASWLEEPPPQWAIGSDGVQDLGRLIKDQRKAWGMTQSQLAKRLGVSTSVIGSWERGGSPSLHSAKSLFEWLGEKPRARPAKRSISMEYGKRIREKRLSLGMSQRALARHLGVQKTSIRGWESGVCSPSEEKLEMLEEWFSKSDDGYLARRIRDKRKNLSMTQRDLAGVVGVNIDTVKGWENHRCMPSLANLQRLTVWLSRGHHWRKKAEEQPEFALFVLPMKEKRQGLGMGAERLDRHLGVGRGRVFAWEAGRSVPSRKCCQKINNWLQAA